MQVADAFLGGSFMVIVFDPSSVVARGVAAQFFMRVAEDEGDDSGYRFGTKTLGLLGLLTLRCCRAYEHKSDSKLWRRCDILIMSLRAITI